VIAASDASAASEPIELSVVVPTFHRDRELARLLTLLGAQELGDRRFEIIVVDDACSPTTPAIVTSAAAAHPDVPILLLNGGGTGPATARNRGWQAAHGALIAFIDDDAYPADAGWLAAGSEAFADPMVSAVSGRVVVPPVSGRPTDFQRNVQRLDGLPFLTCNAFYRRTALAAVGGFDERFRVPFREDSDLQYRVEALGGRMACADRAIVHHPAPDGRFAASLRLQRYSMYNALMYKKHPRRYRAELQALPPLHYYAMLLSLLGALASVLRGRRVFAAFFLLAWAVQECRFFAQRARGASRQPRHLLDLAITSLLIPPLAVYWRLRGAWRFRVLFF
jgi:glycosyltransferase involved in cell wall biosynthesis